MTEAPREDVAGALVGALVDEGEHVDEGGFTLDPATAYRKLREHQLADPLGYLLLLVEAAWLAASAPAGGEIAIETYLQLGTKSTRVVWHGLTPEPARLPDLFAAVLGGVAALEGEALRRRRILQLLGLAANSALGLEPRRIILAACDESGSHNAIAVGPDGSVTPVDIEPLPRSTTSVSVEGGADGWSTTRRIRELIADKCAHTIMIVRVDGQPVSRGPDHERPSPSAPVSHPGVVAGAVGWGRDPEAPGVLWLVNRGVALRDVGLELPRSCEAVVEVDLPVDLSRQRLLEGPELDAIREQVRVAAGRLPARRGPTSRPGAAAPLLILVALAIAVIAGLVWSRAARVDQREAAQTEQRNLRVDACEAGDREACRGLADEGIQPERARQRGCLAGDDQACAALAESVAESLHHGGVAHGPERADANLRVLCEATRAPSYCTTLAELRQNRARAEFRERACQDGSPRACRDRADELRRALGQVRDHEPLRALLVHLCALEPGPACVEAAWYHDYGFVPTVARASATPPAVLLDQACKAKLATACQQRALTSIEHRCFVGTARIDVRQHPAPREGRDPLACYAYGLDHVEASDAARAADAALALELACEFGLAEACHAAAVARRRGLGGRPVDLAGAAERFEEACAAGYTPSCGAPSDATLPPRHEVPRGQAPWR